MLLTARILTEDEARQPQWQRRRRTNICTESHTPQTNQNLWLPDERVRLGQDGRRLESAQG